MSALDQKINAIKVFFGQYPFLANEFPELVAKLQALKTKVESGDDSSSEASSNAPDTLPNYTGLGIIKIDKCPATYEVKGKGKSTKLPKGLQIRITKNDGGNIEADCVHKNKKLSIKVKAEHVELVKDNLGDIQGLNNVDLVVVPQDQNDPNDYISLKHFKNGWNNTLSSANLVINLSKIDTCLHKGLKHIAHKLFQHSATVDTSKKDAPLDKNSVVYGSINFAKEIEGTWTSTYGWSDEDYTKFGTKEITFRYTCFPQAGKNIVLIENIGESKRKDLTKDELDQIQTEKFSTVNIADGSVSVPLIASNPHYKSLSEDQKYAVLASFNNIPDEYKSYLGDLTVFIDKTPTPTGENPILAQTGQTNGVLTLSFSEDVFDPDKVKDIVLGDPNSNQHYTHLDQIVFHELGHIVENKIYLEAVATFKKNYDKLLEDIKNKKDDITAFWQNKLNEYVDGGGMSDSEMHNYIKTNIAKGEITVPEDRNALVEFIKNQRVGGILSRNNIVAILGEIGKDRDQLFFNSIMGDGIGIVKPSGKHYILPSSTSLVWEADPSGTKKATKFTEALSKDGKHLTFYSNVSDQEAFAECFSLYLTQPKTIETISPAIYEYFNDKKYDNHEAFKYEKVEIK